MRMLNLKIFGCLLTFWVSLKSTWMHEISDLWALDGRKTG